jgi:hypothetical protein
MRARPSFAGSTRPQAPERPASRMPGATSAPRPPRQPTVPLTRANSLTQAAWSDAPLAVTGDEQQVAVRDQFVVRQRLAVDPRGEEPADQIRGVRSAPACLQEVVEIAHDLPGGRAGPGRVGGAFVDNVIHPCVELRPVLLGKAREPTEYDRRHRARVQDRHVDDTLPPYLRKKLTRRVSHPVFQCGDRPECEQRRKIRRYLSGPAGRCRWGSVGNQCQCGHEH